MKNRISTLLLLFFAVQLSFAQVKKQYQDEVFSQTTIVVKEDQANDLDVLNELDLDEIGMHQVIKITTEQAAPSTTKLPTSTLIFANTNSVRRAANQQTNEPLAAPQAKFPIQTGTNQTIQSQSKQAFTSSINLPTSETRLAPTNSVNASAATTKQSNTTLATPQAQSSIQTSRNNALTLEDKRPKARRWAKREKKLVKKGPSANAPKKTLTRTKTQTKKQAQQSNTRRTSKAKPQRNYTKSHSAKKVKRSKKRKKRRRFKKAKRKRFKKKNKYRCFQF